MRRLLALLCPLALVLLGACSSDDEKKQDGPGDVSNDFTGTEIERINQYRSQAGLLGVAEAAFLVEAASWHAGYQAYAAEYGHAETGSTATNPFFKGTTEQVRITLAAGAAGVADPAVKAEMLARPDDFQAVDAWWNTVYHRLPLMRHGTTQAGFGDADLAQVLLPGQTLEHDRFAVLVDIADAGSPGSPNYTAALDALGGKHLLFADADGNGFYLWFQRGGSVDPDIAGRIDLQVDISSVNGTASTTVGGSVVGTAPGVVASQITTVLDGRSEFQALANGALVTAILAEPGGSAAAADGDTGLTVDDLDPIVTGSYSTLCLGGISNPTRSLSAWPAPGQTGVEHTFNSDHETPDPIDSDNANGTPDDDLVGAPIHVIFPISNDFNLLSVRLSRVSDDATIPIRVLLGGGTKPAEPAGATYFLDGELDTGELMILAVDPLQPLTAYRVVITGSELMGMVLPNLDWQFATR